MAGGGGQSDNTAETRPCRSRDPDRGPTHWHSLLIAILAVTTLEGSAAQQTTQGACIDRAMTAYERATLALLGREELMFDYREDLRRRRLEEQYCLRIARCVESEREAVAAKFFSCLRDETLEYYDAVPR